MTTIQLPEYHEWQAIRHPMWHDHLMGHMPPGEPWANRVSREDCPECMTDVFLPAIHERLFESDDTFDMIWSLQDGYGEPGFTPPQDYDWSGIRDSSPAAIYRIAQYLGLV